MTRKITTWFQLRETQDGEMAINLEVEQRDRFTATVVDDLDELGVPTDEQPGLRERAVEAFWDAERSAYLLSNPDAE